MEKASHNPVEMSMEEWEFLPDNTSFLEFGLEDVQDLLSNEIIYMDYFREQPKLLEPQQHREKSPAELLADNSHENYAEFKDISISHVFFKLKPMGEEELMDMKAGSPKHCTAELVAPQPPPAFEFTEGGEVEEKIGAAQQQEEKPGWEGFGIGICRWRLTGIGALCSMGAAAAATICIVVLGGRQQRQHRRQQNHMLRFHIRADNKGLTQVVEQASRLNQALAAARGAPAMMTTAKISFGRYCDGI